MCGFVGIALSRSSNREIQEGTLVRARDTLVHRGPDDAGLFIRPRVGLGHRRLSIVDLEAGRQPFASEDGVLQLVYNGEVYNHLDLRRDLEHRGHHYRSRCDTETVLRLQQEFGSRAVERMRGMFAFGVWDANEETLFLARDRLGIKPLYYILLEDGSIAFASEMKAILALGVVSPELNLPALPDYLANHAPSGEETLFRGIRRLAPGHTLRWKDGHVAIQRYWEPDFEPFAPGEAGPDPVGTLRELLTESVRLRLMADVPLGVFLSGGIDSAAITGIMSGMVHEPVKSFSVAFQERDANELSYAREAARAFGTEHHEVVVGRKEFFSALPGLIWHEDEPIAFPSSVPLYFVARLAAENVKVVLTGEGSDEFLGGYARYRKTLLNLRLGRGLARATPEFVRAALRSMIRTLPQSWRGRQRAERTFLCLPADIMSLYLDAFAVFSRERQTHLFRPEVQEQLRMIDPYQHHRTILDRASDWPTHHQLLRLDVGTYLQELLMKQDQMSMAASVESRVPFLDHHFVEYAARLPSSLKLRGRQGKWILHQAMDGLVPERILKRKKMGFPVPFGHWVRSGQAPEVESVLLSDQASDRQLFDPGYVRRILGQHRKGHADHSERIWSLLNLEFWLRSCVDGEEVERPQAVGTPQLASSISV